MKQTIYEFPRQRMGMEPTEVFRGGGIAIVVLASKPIQAIAEKAAALSHEPIEVVMGRLARRIGDDYMGEGAIARRGPVRRRPRRS